MKEENITYKKKKVSIYDMLQIILYLILPFLFIINEYLFIFAIVLKSIFQIIHYKDRGSLFILLMLDSFLYSSVTIMSLKLYDWIIVAYFIYILLKRKGKLIFNKRVFFFLMVDVLVLIFHTIGSSQLLEFIRYIISLILILDIINSEQNFEIIDNDIARISYANIYNAVLVYLLIRMNYFKNISDVLLSTSVYIYKDEIRLNGFFTDPNKYMIFSLCLIFIAEMYVQRKNIANKIIIMAMIGAVISMSRTSLICIAVYIFMKLLVKIKQKSYVLYYVSITVLSILLIMSVVNPDILNGIIENIFTLSAKLLGREHTLKVNASFEDDNRMRIWMMAFNYIKQKPIIGYGWIANEQLLPYPTHNTLISLLLDGGLIVLMSYIYTFLPLFKNKRQDIVIPYIIVPLLLLDLGNYRLWYLLLGLVIKKDK